MKDRINKIGKSIVKGNFFAKYFAVFSVVIIVYMCIIGVFLLVFTMHYWRSNKLDMLYKNACNISETTSEALTQAAKSDDYERATIVICSSLKEISDSLEADIFVCNMDGEVILCQHMLSPDFTVTQSGHCPFHSSYKLSEETIARAENGGFSEYSRLDGIFADLHAVAIVPVTINKSVVGVVVATASITDELENYSMRVLGMFIMAAAFAMLIVSIAVYILTDKLTKPLREMAEATRHYAKGDFSYRVKVKGDDELSALIRDFNSMAKALDALESSRRNFVANVSHEFKTPMTTIGGFINGILDGTIERDKQEYYLNIVSGEVKRLSKLVNTMLNISKIETGNVELKYQSFDLTDMILSCVWGFEQITQQRNITVTGMDNLESMQINADPDMINQVIYNLVDNAVKFTNDSGEISLSCAQTSSDVFFTIRNTGRGIPPDETEKVFERFYKIDKSRSTDVKSVGLGLHIVKSIVELHNGTISVSSVENAYTEFNLRLPKDLNSPNGK